MWRTKVRVASIVVCGVLGGCSAEQASDNAVEGHADSMPKILESEAEARQLAKAALLGDGPAAWALAVNYADSNSDLYDLWATIAIENQEPNALITVGGRYAMSENPCQVARGVFLMKQALLRKKEFAAEASRSQEIAEAEKLIEGKLENCLTPFQ